MSKTPPLALLFLILSAGCGANQLAQSFELDRLRVLGVRAEPAEPQPGDTVQFESLVYAPAGSGVEGVIWFGCLPTGADDFGCELNDSLLEDFEDLDPENMSPAELAELFEQLQAAGFIGYEPDLPPSWVVPDDALEGLSEAESQEGVSAVINLTAIETGAGDEADTEIAYKRLPISLANTPNHNPEVLGIEVEGTLVPLGGTVQVGVGREITLEPILGEGSIEDYEFTNSDGEVETRTEEPYLTWYTENGAFDQAFSLHPYLDVEWTPVLDSESSMVIAVARDRRGGMAWSWFKAVVDCDLPKLPGPQLCADQ